MSPDARVDFTAPNVGNWIDDTPLEEAEQIMKPLMEMVAQIQRRAEQVGERAKNGQPPQAPKAKGAKLRKA